MVVKYNLGYNVPHFDLLVTRELNFLEREGYNASFILNEDLLSGTLNVDRKLNKKTLDILAIAPHTILFPFG